jgi:hypothetical protein
LLIFPIGGVGGQLSAVTGSMLPMLFTAIAMVALVGKMTQHDIRPKKLGRVKPKKFDRR